MAETIIEVSGADFRGKSTQAELLTYFAWDKPTYNFGGFGKYSDRFPMNLPLQEDWRWWFQETTPEQLGDVLTEAYKARQHAVEMSPYEIGVVERGASMIRAQLTANFATRREIEVAECAEEMSTIIDTRLECPSKEVERFEFVLHEDTIWTEQIAPYLPYVRHARSQNPDYTSSQNEFYDQYLENLSRALGHFAVADYVIEVPVNGAAIDVQNSIRHHASLQRLKLPTLLEQNPLVMGIGGMSESGKGTLAQRLANDHGFTRLKLGFFNEMTRNADGGQRYGDPHLIAMNALRFLANNRHMDRVSLESLYGPHLPAEFKMLLGARWKTVMIEASDEVRMKRALKESDIDEAEAALALQRRKDSLKLAKGMTEYQEIADIFVNNEGSTDTMLKNVVEGLGI